MIPINNIILWIVFSILGLLAAIGSLIYIGVSDYFYKQDVVIMLLGIVLFLGSAIQLSDSIAWFLYSQGKNVSQTTTYYP